jgi:Beta-ketoacyl synthase, N-terminal domain
MPLLFLAPSMTELDIVGLGAWSQKFSNWQELAEGLRSDEWQSDVVLQPDLIPARERRRAPQLVKMAIEVMSQACEMAGLNMDQVATVFSSAMGDMQITDYLCHALAQSPKLVSPTKFHNSVHNAATGYWSITTGSFGPASAVSAFEFTPSMAFLEAATQAAEENTPVLVVTQELAAPVALLHTCPAMHPFSAAFLLAPANYCAKRICRLQFAVSNGPVEWPLLPDSLREDFDSNLSAKLLPLLSAMVVAGEDPDTAMLRFPVSPHAALELSIVDAAARETVSA